MSQVKVIFEELSIMETQVNSDSLELKAIKRALLSLRGTRPHL